MNFRNLLIYTTFFLVSVTVNGQYYETGQDPASIRWMQIKTPRFKVIYPEKYGSEGVAMAKSLDSSYLKLTALFPPKKFRIPVVIHSYTTHSNGYVSWAPRRMELYPTPEQNTIPLDPKDQLSLHELTHVLQMESLNSGFTKVMSYGFGQQFTGIVSSLLPLWYLEGKAVLAESILSSSGRGRSASFQKQLKAISVEKGMYNYDKILNGSYRDFVPNHYETGYQMVAWSYANYDHELWNNVLSFTANYPYTVVPVTFSLYKQAKITKGKLFRKTFTGLGDLWKKDLAGMSEDQYEILNPPKKGKYISYFSPVIAGNDSVIAIKTSLSRPSSFVLIRPSQKSEKRLKTPGFVNPNVLSYASGKIVWVENHSDPRWKNRNYSVIKIMDLKRHVTKKLSQRTRYLAAALSPNGKTIAAVQNTVSNQTFLVLIDPEDGSLISSVPSPSNIYLQKPQWSADGSEITAISLSKDGEGIVSFSVAKNQWKTLIQPGTDDLQSAFLANDSLFFISSSSGTDNLYLFKSGRTSLITKSEFGVTDPSVKGKSIVFADYKSTGNNISLLRIHENEDFKSEATQSTFIIDRIDSIRKPDPVSLSGNYKPVPFRKWQHPFNVHSWMPFYADIEKIQSDPLSVRPGVTLMSQNVLSTLISSLGYEYSANKRHLIHSRVTWKGFYPVIESQLDYGDDPVIDKLSATVADPSTRYNSLRFLNTISVPLQFSSGKFNQYFYSSVTSDYKNRYIWQKELLRYDYGQNELTTRIFFSNYFRSSVRDINPRWGQTIDLNYTFSPFDKTINGTSRSVRSTFYFPGLFSNNSIRIRLEAEKQELQKYYMSNRINWPRSYKNIFSQRLNFASFEYVFPLLYPDFNVPGVLFIKRIRGSLFYDYAQGRDNAYFHETSSGLVFDYSHKYWESFRTFGFELLSDFHLLRSPFMISGGVQAAWKELNTAPSIEFLLNIDVFGMNIGRGRLR